MDTQIFEKLKDKAIPVETIMEIYNTSRANVLDVEETTGMNALMYACKYKRSKRLIKLLLELGADVSQIDKNGWNALMLACKYRKDADIIELLLQAGAKNYIDQVNSKGWNALMIACEKRCDIKIIKLLLDSGADKYLNQTTIDGWNVLMLACQFKLDMEFFKLLLDYGANQYLNQTNKDGWNVLMLACQFKFNMEFFKLLLDYGADKYLNHTNKDGWNVLMLVCQFKLDVKIFKLLLDYGANQYLNQTTTDGWNVLMLGVRYNFNPEIVKLLLDSGADKYLNETNKDGWNVLMIACKHIQNPKIIKILLENGANKYIEQQSAMEKTNALVLATEFKKSDSFIKILLEYGADKLIKCVNNKNRNALYFAIKNDLGPVVYLLYNIDPQYHIEYCLKMINDGKLHADDVSKYIPLPPKMLSSRKINAYTILGLDKSVSQKTIRQRYITLRKQLLTNVELSKSYSGEKDSYEQLIGEAYNILKSPEKRKSYDEKIELPRQELLKKIEILCYNDTDPVSLRKFQNLRLDELRRVLVIFEETCIQLNEKGYCFEQDTLRELAKRDKWENPLTRKPFQESVKKLL